jgi:molybdopterin molybdotransferase
MTGAPMPEGSDAMLPKEDVREDAQEVLVFCPVKTHENYIFQGEDIKKGQPLISPGERLDFVRLGLLAGMGLAEVPVFRPPEIGILCTGDELIPPGNPLPPGKIYNNNGVLLSTRLEELGFHPRLLPIMEDESETAAAAIRPLMEGTSAFPGLDILITTGAVSVGDKDIMQDVLTRLEAERLFWRMNFKPGSAILCGVYREKLLLCLSGNHFAAVANLELLVRPVLAKLARRPDLETRRLQARLKNPFPKPSGARRFIRARLLAEKESGLPWVSLPEGHASGNMRSLLGCNCFVDIPALSGALSAGSIVEVVQYNV